MKRVVMLLVALLACKEEKKQGPFSMAPEPGKLAPREVPGLGVTVEVPENAQVVADALRWRPAQVSVRAGEDAEFTEFAKLPSTRRYTKKETTADGWDVRWDDTFADTPIYNVNIHRTIGGRVIECEGYSTVRSAVAQIEAACASLKAK